MVIRLNKGGWLRIVEASIAILVVMGVVLIVIGNQPVKKNQDLSDKTTEIAELIAMNTSLRNIILNYDPSLPRSDNTNAQILNEVNGFVGANIGRKDLRYSFAICLPDDVCSLDSYPADPSKEVYVSDRIISTTPDRAAFSPRKIKVYLWTAG